MKKIIVALFLVLSSTSLFADTLVTDLIKSGTVLRVGKVIQAQSRENFIFMQRGRLKPVWGYNYDRIHCGMTFHNVNETLSEGSEITVSHIETRDAKEFSSHSTKLWFSDGDGAKFLSCYQDYENGKENPLTMAEFQNIVGSYLTVVSE